jgi:hypothetical protein
VVAIQFYQASQQLAVAEQVLLTLAVALVLLVVLVVVVQAEAMAAQVTHHQQAQVKEITAVMAAENLEAVAVVHQ